MAMYFLVHDRAFIEEDLPPALAAAWRQRSFAPCRPMCRQWRPAALAYAARYHIREDDLLLPRIDDLPFDRAFWRVLAGELLLFAANEIPEFPTRLDSLAWLLTGETAPADVTDRGKLHPFHQALHGSRDLRFGPAVYRPEHAGWNNAADVRRLAEYLAAIDPGLWTAGQLAGLPDLADEDDRADELAFAREWFAVLGDLYTRASDRGQVIVMEQIF